MTWMQHRLSLALGLSLLVHALPFASDIIRPPEVRKPPPVIEARLLPPPPAAPVQEQVPLVLPEQPKPKTEPPRQPPKPEKPVPPKPEPIVKARPELKPPPEKPAAQKTDWVAEVKKQFKDLQQRGLFYPVEAIAQGLEGEAVVLVYLDESGNTVAARIEQSSGHKILDDAALRAVRSLKSLPAAAPRETQLPVRFRLR